MRGDPTWECPKGSALSNTFAVSYPQPSTMHTYFRAAAFAAFLSAVTASPLPDFSYVLPVSAQPDNTPIPFQDFSAQTSINPDSYNLEQPQILAQSLSTSPDSYNLEQPQIPSQSPGTSPDGYNLEQPQILAESPDERMDETVKGDSPNNNDPLPLPITASNAKYLPSDQRFQLAPCDARSSVCCQRAYNGENSQSATCAASMCFQSPFPFFYPPPQIGSPTCAPEKSLEFVGSDHMPMVDTSNAKFGKYCLAPHYFNNCDKMWDWVWVSLQSILVPLFAHQIYPVCPFTAGSVQDMKEVLTLTWATMQNNRAPQDMIVIQHVNEYP